MAAKQTDKHDFIRKSSSYLPTELPTGDLSSLFTSVERILVLFSLMVEPIYDMLRMARAKSYRRACYIEVYFYSAPVASGREGRYIVSRDSLLISYSSLVIETWFGLSEIENSTVITD